MMKKTISDFEQIFQLQGRRYAAGGRLFLNHSGGSVKGLFRGKSLIIRLFTDFEIAGRNVYVRLTVDERTKRIRLPKGEKTMTVCLPFGEHTFTLVKLTEATNGALGLTAVETDGEFLPLTERPRLKLEFIGDSITTGFGVLAPSAEGEYRTKEQDVTKAFPHLVSRVLDAEYHTVAAGGWPIYRSKYADHAIPEIYDHIDFFRDPAPWDFDSFKPDALVVTLGTNDFSYLADLTPEKRAAEREEVKKHFLRFLRHLLAQNIPIVLVCGFFEYPDLGVLTEEVKKELNTPLISTLEVESARSLSDVRAGHPGRIAHRRSAKKLCAVLRGILPARRRDDSV